MVWASFGLSLTALIVAGGAAALTWKADQTVMKLERQRQEKNRRARERRKERRNDTKGSV